MKFRKSVILLSAIVLGAVTAAPAQANPSPVVLDGNEVYATGDSQRSIEIVDRAGRWFWVSPGRGLNAGSNNWIQGIHVPNNCNAWIWTYAWNTTTNKWVRTATSQPRIYGSGYRWDVYGPNRHYDTRIVC